MIRFNNFLVTVFIITIISLISGCGNKGTSKAYQGPLSTNCSSEFVSNYNSVTLACSGTLYNEMIQRCRNLATEFKSKYADVSCNALLSDPNSLDKKEKLVNASEEMDKILNQLKLD